MVPAEFITLSVTEYLSLSVLLRQEPTLVPRGLGINTRLALSRVTRFNN